MGASVRQISDPQSYAIFFGAEFARTVRSIERIAGTAAEDVAQEAFLVALQNWERVAELEAPDTWVRLVARRIAWRRRGREQTRAEREAAAGSFARTADDLPDVDLRRAVEGLPSRHRAAIILHYLAGLNVSEVAEHLNASQSAAKVWLFRGRNQLAYTLLGHEGRWTSKHRWREDDVAARLRQTGDDLYTDMVVDQVSARNVRWILHLQGGTYLLETDDGERLDRGQFRVRARSIVLIPWNLSGQATLATNIDGDRARFRLVDDTTAPTMGVPDEVYLRLLLGSDSFVRTR